MKVTEINSVQLHLMVSPELMACLQAAAQARGVTVAKLARGTLDQFRDGPPPAPKGLPPNIWRLKR
jgi:hypothetical protein